MTLHEYLEAENQKAKDYMDAHPGCWICTTTSDEKHWAEYGIHTVEDYKRYILECSISDAHKDLYGCRPRYMNFKEMTMEQLEAELEKIASALREEFENEKKNEWIDPAGGVHYSNEDEFDDPAAMYE